MSAFRDTSGIFTTKYEDYMDKSATLSMYAPNNFGYMKPEPNMKIEDEEDLLYGESGNAFKMTSVRASKIHYL